MRYLTVQDMLWIGLQVSGTTPTFLYAPLEEATYTQYVYGGSATVVEHGERFWRGWRRMRPFDRGNEATGFVALAAFLALNGYDLQVRDEDGARWYLGQDGLGGALHHAEHHEAGHNPPTRAVIEEVLARYPQTIRALGEVTVAASPEPMAERSGETGGDYKGL